MDKPKQYLRVTSPIETLCYVYFAAPYSSSEEVTIPAGVELNLFEQPDIDEKYRYEVSVVENKKWAPFILSSSMRMDKNFRYGYSFCLSKEDLLEKCEIITQPEKQETPELRFYNAIKGSLFGTAVGDAIGLPFEGMSRRRIAKFATSPLEHRFFFGKGMLSDDTEHTCMVAHALIFSKGDSETFADNMAWSLRWWLLGLPAGIGLATLKACLKLWLFINPNKSGVYSAGNGPGMRSALIGVYAHDNAALRKQLITINTKITHTDEKAVLGSLIIAELAANNVTNDPVTTDNIREKLAHIIQNNDELTEIVTSAVESVKKEQTAIDYCEQLGFKKGVGGYIYHTLPVVLHIVLRHNDNYEAAITEAIECGGDTDTVAAIIGGIVGARVGHDGIKQSWIKNLKDWPRTKAYLYKLCEELVCVKYQQSSGTTFLIDPIRIWLRNALFMIWVLAHGFRRLLPPY
jgi:ADP-ribosylglycohydrolase